MLVRRNGWSRDIYRGQVAGRQGTSCFSGERAEGTDPKTGRPILDCRRRRTARRIGSAHSAAGFDACRLVPGLSQRCRAGDDNERRGGLCISVRSIPANDSGGAGAGAAGGRHGHRGDSGIDRSWKQAFWRLPAIRMPWPRQCSACSRPPNMRGSLPPPAASSFANATHWRDRRPLWLHSIGRRCHDARACPACFHL